MAFDPKKYIAEKTGQPVKEAEQEFGIGDVTRPLVQGASLGFSDEAGGAALTLKDLLTGKSGVNMEAIKKAYEEHRDEERKYNEEAEKRHPALYKTLELAGGLASPIGIAGKVAKGAGLAKKALTLGAQGAVLGGLSGAGFSKGQDAGEVAQDAAGGAAVGALPGAVLGGAAGVTKLGEHIPIFGIGKTSQGLEQGLMGNLPSNLKFTESVENLLGKLGGKKQELSKAYEDILNKAASEGKKIDGSDFIEFAKKLEDELKYAKTPEVREDISKVLNDVRAYTQRTPGVGLTPIETPLLDPREAQHLKSSLGEKAAFSATSPQLQTAEGRSLAGKLKGNLSDTIGENLPGFKSTDKQYGELEGVLRQLGIKPEKLYTKNVATGKLEISPKTLNTVQTLLKRSVNEKASGDVAKKSVGLLDQGMQKLGISDANSMQTLLDKAKSSNVFDKPLSKAASYLGYGAGKTLSAEPTVRALSMAPEAIDAYDRKPHNSYTLSDGVKTASKEEMHQLADTAMSIKGLEQQGKNLKDAVNKGNLRATNQLMFDLLQRPQFRNSVEGVVSDKEDDDN